MPRVSKSALWLPLTLVTGRDLNKESARDRGDKKPLSFAWVLTDLSSADISYLEIVEIHRNVSFFQSNILQSSSSYLTQKWPK